MIRAIFGLALVMAISLFATPGGATAAGRYERWQTGKPFIIGAMYYDLAVVIHVSMSSSKPA